MDKKFFALVLISLVFLAGGCGSDSDSPVTSTTDVNSAMTGAWTSSNSGTATIEDTAENEDLEVLLAELGDEVPSDVLEEYRNTKNDKISAPVTRVMAVFEDCNVSWDTGTAKLTAIVIISGDSAFMPIAFNGAALSTRRNSTNEWTATIPNAGTLTISMTSDEKMTLSGRVKYLGYDCEFSTVMDKKPANSLNPDTVLAGTWSLDGTQGGGYFAADGRIIAAAAPESVSMFFSGTASDLSTASFCSLRMRTASTEEHAETSLLQDISDGRGILTNIYGDVYRFMAEDGSESIIFVENVDEIFVFMLENEDSNGQVCMFLPLKKVSVNVEEAMRKTWTASSGMGGGYMSDFRGDGEEVELLNLLCAFSFSLRNAELNFSGVRLNDDGTVTAAMDINSSFLCANKILASLPGISEDDMVIPISENSRQVTMTRSGNFLQFSHDGDTYKLSFISDTEAFLAVTPDRAQVGEGEFAIRMRASE